jgi:hypothetical protein
MSPLPTCKCLSALLTTVAKSGQLHRRTRHRASRDLEKMRPAPCTSPPLPQSPPSLRKSRRSAQAPTLTAVLVPHQLEALVDNVAMDSTTANAARAG